MLDQMMVYEDVLPVYEQTTRFTGNGEYFEERNLLKIVPGGIKCSE